MSNHRTQSVAASAAFISSIVLATWMVGHVGTQYDPHGPHVLPVWPGILAPSGVYVVGVTLVLRDVVQRTLGVRAAFAMILIGAALAWLFSPTLAVASAVAFLASETVDLLVFWTLERFGFARAMVASNIAGLVVDSLVFLWLAFGSLAFIEGQMIGKAWATLAALLILTLMRRRVR